MKNTHNINNWDLVDISCPHIVGEFLAREGSEILKMLAKSTNIWERRIAIISTSIGVMSHNKATQLKKGGEILCFVG
jgi:3-methyladenine DNA glycosylase AlkD